MAHLVSVTSCLRVATPAVCVNHLVVVEVHERAYWVAAMCPESTSAQCVSKVLDQTSRYQFPSKELQPARVEQVLFKADASTPAACVIPSDTSSCQIQRLQSTHAQAVSQQEIPVATGSLSSAR